MALASAQVIDAVVTRLSGNTPAGTRVYASRLWPLAEADLPAWRVSAGDEEIEAETVHYPAILLHRLPVRCEGYVKANADADDAMHAMAEQALTALYDTQPHATLGLSVQSNHPARIERDVVSEGQANLGRITVELSIKYRTAANNPGTLI